MKATFLLDAKVSQSKRDLPYVESSFCHARNLRKRKEPSYSVHTVEEEMVITVRSLAFTSCDRWTQQVSAKVCSKRLKTSSKEARHDINWLWHFSVEIRSSFALIWDLCHLVPLESH